MFIVEEEFRKQWFGTYLARTALSYLGKRNIGLNGMPDRIDTYKNIGFKPAFKCIRYSTKGEGSQSKGTIDTKDANNINFEELVKYDTQDVLSEQAVVYRHGSVNLIAVRYVFRIKE